MDEKKLREMPFSEFLRFGTFKTHDEYAAGGHLIPPKTRLITYHKVTNDAIDHELQHHIEFLNTTISTLGISLDSAEGEFSLDYRGRRYDVVVDNGSITLDDTYIDLSEEPTEVDLTRPITLVNDTLYKFVVVEERKEGGD